MIGTDARARITIVMAAGIAALCTAGVTGFADPGMLPSLLDGTERALRRAPRGRPSPTALTDREVA